MSNEFTKIVAIAVGGDNFTEIVAISNPEDIGNTVEVANVAALPTPSLALQGLIHFAKAENTYHVVNLAGNAFEEFGAGGGAGGMNFKGDYNAATDTPSLDDGTPIGVTKGDVYVVSVAGTFFTIEVEVGDQLYAEIDSAVLEADWSIVQANLTPAIIKSQYESNADTNAFTDAEQTKLTGIETSATADQSGAEIKTAYEAEANAYTDTKNTKLSGIETSATADQTDAEIETG